MAQLDLLVRMVRMALKDLLAKTGLKDSLVNKDLPVRMARKDLLAKTGLKDLLANKDLQAKMGLLAKTIESRPLAFRQH